MGRVSDSVAEACELVFEEGEQGNDKDRGSVQLMKKSLVSSLRKLNLSHLHSNTH